ncbi:UBE3A [Symbiodinium necroappetens]|uniref:HECT-type E3 ubiquitin transferase n=1 Tax=Symbiodinium necroappetens TaxID=1628268 RepID=A0A812LLY0_9DINO|nr:UBE3A [Symbiodinium necroappetens]
MPVRGWSSLRLLVQKNGAGDDRLPTAYTCFSLLLLPLYSSVEVLKKNMLLAITNSEGFGLK